MSSTKLSAYCSKVIEAGWIAAVIMVPLYFNVYSSRVFEPDKLTLLRSIAVFMAAAWLIKTVEEASQGQPVFRFSWRTPLVAITLVLVVIYLLTTLTSVTPYTSLWGSYQRLQGTYTTLSYIVIFFLILNEMRHREQLDRLVTAAIITSVPISLYGLIQHYGIDPLPWGGDVTRRVASNMGNAIFISAYEIMIFFLTLGRIVESFIAILTEEEAHVADILRAAAYIFAALIQLITIWFSQSRGPWVGLMVGAFAFVLFGLLALRRAAPEKGATTWRDVLKALGGTVAMTTGVGFVALLAVRRAWKWLWLSWVLLAILGASFLVLFNLPDTPLEDLRNTPYIGRLGKIFQTERGTGKVRVLIWEGAVDMITPHEPLGYPTQDPSQPLKPDKLNFLRPLIGYGPESMYVAYNSFYPAELAHYEKRNASPDRSHNETFDALVITGVVGLVAYMALFGSIFYLGLKWLGWIEDERQKRAFLVLYLLWGFLASVGSVVIGGPEFFGVGLPFGFTIGLVLYAILYALFRDGVELLAFALFWGIVSLLSLGIVALSGSGVGILMGAVAGLGLIGALFYVLGHWTFEQGAAQRSETEEQDAETRPSSIPPLLILSLVVAIIAHFVEIHFGIAIAATRTYFWVYAALLVLLGTGMLQHPAAQAVASDASPPAQSKPASSSRRSRRKRRRRPRRAARSSSRTFSFKPSTWFGPVLVAAFVIALILGTLGLDFVTNSGRIAAEANCNPSVGRLLYPCWGSTAWSIVSHDLTTLPKKGNERPQEVGSFMTLGLFVLTLFIGAVITTSEMARRGLFKRRAESWGWGALVLVSISVLVGLVVLLSIADWHLKLGLMHRSLPQNDPIRLIQGLLDATMYLSSNLMILYKFVFLFILLTGLALLIGKRLPANWSTPWGLMAAVPLIIIAIIIIHQTNIKVIQADVLYKEGERWSSQGQQDIAIAHYKRALELAPEEDFYYLFAGKAYLEKSPSAPQQGCIITGEPDISGILSMSIEKTARLCREDLLIAARTILFEARHINPLNTDHTANLARLHNQWANFSTSAEEKSDLIEQAIGYYQQATQLSPQNTIVWDELATVYLVQKQDLEKAQETTAHLLALDDQFYKAYLLKGDLLQTEMQSVNNQIAAKQNELASAPEEEQAAIQAEIERLRAQAEAKLEEAIDAYLKAVELNRRLVSVYATIALAYEQMGQLEEAVATLNDAAVANPRSGEPYIALAELYRRNDNLEAAVAAYRQAIARKPNNVDYRLALANMLESLGRIEEALVEVQEAARLRPNDPVLRQNLALMYRELKMYPEALAEAQAAAQLAPNDPTPQLIIGDVSRMLNDLETAALAYERALALDPNLATAWSVHLNLALIYQQTGQLDRALAHGGAALQRAPENQRQQINELVVQLEQQNSETP